MTEKLRALGYKDIGGDDLPSHPAGRSTVAGAMPPDNTWEHQVATAAKSAQRARTEMDDGEQRGPPGSASRLGSSTYATQGRLRFPENTTHLPDVRPMLAQRRRRWANIGQTLGKCVVFAGNCHSTPVLYRHTIAKMA